MQIPCGNTDYKSPSRVADSEMEVLFHLRNLTFIAPHCAHLPPTEFRGLFQLLYADQEKFGAGGDARSRVSFYATLTMELHFNMAL